MIAELDGSSRVEAGSLQRARVLIVDDEDYMCRMYSRMLGKHHDVVVAQGGPAALAVLTNDTRFDVIVCDMMMPEIDGPRLFEALRRVEPDLTSRMLFCSGGAYTGEAHAFSLTLAHRFIEKPVSRDRLLESIAAVVAEHASP